MLALRDAMAKLGADVRNNEIGEDIDGYIFDSVWFNERLLDRLARQESPLVLHRIDGPIHLYRGKDKAIDDRVMAINTLFATASVIQSEFTLRMLRRVGYDPVAPVIVRNAPDPLIFNRDGRNPFSHHRKTRLISTSWSNNPRKGGDVYGWLDRNLDFDRYDYTFVGRVATPLKNIRVIEPLPSRELAVHLKNSDVYLTASQNDPCSNALVEASAVGCRQSICGREGTRNS
ncbi:MAG: glycosyltransferase family 4 protein [Blastochloris sp.]|nr:glycosyltransferase family 4 protein [Blastochloris sp.]